MFDREYLDGMIDVFPYFIAATLAAAPMAIVLPATYCFPFYYMVGLRSGWQYVMWFYLIMATLQVTPQLCSAYQRSSFSIHMMNHQSISYDNAHQSIL